MQLQLPTLLGTRRQTLMGAGRRAWMHRVRLALIVLAVTWAAQHALFGRSGYLALRQRQHQYQTELARVQTLENQNRELNQAVRSLRSDPNAIEDIAREKLHLTRPGEVVYTYPVAGPNAAGSPADAALH
ncbi:MAG TPA: septum formation initiator family protein [Terriglobales bacterium]|jgi:cell division protein FtsB